MKVFESLAIVGAMALLNCCPVFAQTGAFPRVTTHYFGKKQANAPVLRRTRANGAYEIVFPVTRLAPARMDKPDGYLIQDRAVIAPGVEIRIPEGRKWDNRMPAPPPSITAAGRPLKVDFGKFLSDPKVWTHEVLNDTLYELGRDYFKKDAYWFFGLTKAHGKTYVGVCWYSMASSEPDTHALVLRLDWKGNTIEPTPVKALPDIPTSAEFPMALDTIPNGDLVVSGGGKLLEMNPKGEWNNVPAPAALLKDNPRLSAYSDCWRRGRWLLICHATYVGKNTSYQVVVQDDASRRSVEAFTWSVPTR